VPVKKSRFADEDASDDDAKDDWDVSSDEDAPAKPAAVVGSMRNKGSTKQKIAAKEAEERKRLEALEEEVRFLFSALSSFLSWSSPHAHLFPL
jgi:translation initiation factor 3 subunit J